AIFVVLFVLANRWYLSHKKWTPQYLANPVVTFLGTSPIFQSSPNLFEMEVSEEEIVEMHRRHQNEEPLTPVASPLKNVVMLVLESVPAEFLKNYDSDHDYTPNLFAYSNISLKVNHAYAHTPSTNKSMFSLLTSLYPWISFSSITSQHSDLPVPSLGSVLKKHRYHTAFITSADNRFQNIDKFLAHQ